MFDARSILLMTRAVLTLSLVVGVLVVSTVSFAQTPADGQGKVKIEWLGHEFYRLTSPKGVVVITSPWLANPDGPVPLDWETGSWRRDSRRSSSGALESAINLS